MKRIVFLIIASLLVLGLVLPGCDGNGANVIKIAVCGPLTDLQGQNHLQGATMAAGEINADGGVTVGGVNYTVQVVQVETNESAAGELGATGTANLQYVIDDVAFCVGGFRTEVVDVYREVAMDAKKIFMNCGAATDYLQFDVVTDYPTYKYWFKGTPYNSTFLVKSILKMTATIGGVLSGTLAGYEASHPSLVQDAYKVGTDESTPLRVCIVMEDAAWCAGMVTAAQTYLPYLGFNVTDTVLLAPTALAITPGQWASIAADNPHIIFTAFSGAVGALYSEGRVANNIPAVTIGINVPGQQKSHWGNTGGDCEGEIMLDTWGVGMNNTPLTHDFFAAYELATDRYPVYTAGTYDSVYAVTDAMEATNSLDSDTLVTYLENNYYTNGVASDVVGQYPEPAITVTPGSVYALNETQVRAIYDIDSYGYVYNQADWTCGEASMPHIQHDLIYGPGYATGVGTQWQQPTTAVGEKVGVWPMDLGDVPALVDQYGDWSFEYEGTQGLALLIGSTEPTGGMLTIPYDPYA